MLRRQCLRGGGILRREGRVAVRGEVFLQHLAYVGLVVDDQEGGFGGRGHFSLLPALLRAERWPRSGRTGKSYIGGVALWELRVPGRAAMKQLKQNPPPPEAPAPRRCRRLQRRIVQRRGGCLQCRSTPSADGLIHRKQISPSREIRLLQ